MGKFEGPGPARCKARPPGALVNLDVGEDVGLTDSSGDNGVVAPVCPDRVDSGGGGSEAVVVPDERTPREESPVGVPVLGPDPATGEAAPVIGRCPLPGVD